MTVLPPMDLRQPLFDELPDDWGLMYLGGQHLFVGKNPPAKVTSRVYRPYNVNRTHAFMVRGTDTMRRLYRHRTWNKWQSKHHIDHHLGRLVEREYMVIRTIKTNPGRTTFSRWATR